MLNINAISSKIIGNNLRESFDVTERTKLKLIIVFSIVGTLAVMVDHLFNILTNNYTIKHLGAILFYILFGISTFLIYKGKHFSAKMFFCSFSLFLIAKDHYCYGSNIAVETLYLALISICAYLFESRTSLIFLVLTLILYTSLFCLDYYREPPYIQYIQPYYEIKYLMSIFACITLASLLKTILRENKTYNKLQNKQNNRLLQHNEQLKNFNHILMNDVNLPTKNIINFANLIQENLAGNTNNKDRYIRHIVESSQKLNTTIDQLNNFKKFNQTEFISEEININDILLDAYKDQKELIDAKAISITSESVSNVISMPYPIFIILKNIIRHILVNSNPIESFIHFSFTEENKHIHLFIESTSKDDFSIRPDVKKQVFKPIHHKEYNNSLELNIVNRMLYKISGNISISRDKNISYRIEFPVKYKTSK